MAKKRLSNAEIEAQQNLARIELYTNAVNLIYDDFIEDLAKMASALPGGISKVKVFTFDDFPSIKTRLNNLIRETSLKAISAINIGKEDAILRANAKNDALVNKFVEITKSNVPRSKLPKFKAKIATYNDRNLTAAITRETKSALSKNVYKITKQFTRIAELGIDRGIAQGKPARTLASEIKKAVKEPEFTFRRVRNDKGNLEWSKAAKRYQAENPPGTGKYLSPQKNYERLTRTEINMSYRTADHNRTAVMDFVVGRRVNLSTNANHCPFCIEMAGVYPVNFLFRLWHPNCRCYVTTILKTAEEMQRDSILIIQGKEPLALSVNRVKSPNPNLTKWIKKNQAKLKGARDRGTAPYWLLDNYQGIKRVPGKVVGGLS